MRRTYIAAVVTILVVLLSACDKPLWIKFSRSSLQPEDSYVSGYQIDLNSIVRNGPLVTYQARELWKLRSDNAVIIGYYGCEKYNKKLTAVVSKVTVNCDRRTIISGVESDIFECDNGTYIPSGRKFSKSESEPIPDLVDSGDLFKYCSRLDTMQAYVTKLLN